MSRVAIIAAMSSELKPLVRGWRHERSNGINLWCLRFDQGEWIAACAGAGVQAAARAFAEAEKGGALDLVISTGWAGALRKELAPGQVYWVTGVIDALTGERFPVSHDADEPEDLKGHGFSRATAAPKNDEALAAEGMPATRENFPQGLKPQKFYSPVSGAAEAAPFQNDCCLATSSRVADAHEKQRLAATYQAGLVDMEAAGVARLAQARGIPFYCIKGISDGYRDQLPDFNRFISVDGHFQLGRFIVFVLPRPWYWLPLVRMGENSKKAAQGIAKSLLDFLEEQGQTRKQNGYPNLTN